MNIRTQYIADYKKTSLAYARLIQTEIEKTNFDFSEATQEEFFEAVDEACKTIIDKLP